jgi:hypothetical protein
MRVLAQTTPVEPKRLGNLKVRVSRVEETALVADGAGSSSSRYFGRTDFTVKNVGDFVICARLAPTIEQYPKSPMQKLRTIRQRLPEHSVDHLEPGKESVGHLDFPISFPLARPNYVLVLQQLGLTQRCEDRQNPHEIFPRSSAFVRLSLPRTDR